MLSSPWTISYQAPLSSTISLSLLRFVSIESVMLSKHLIRCCSHPFAFNLSQHQGLYSSESDLHIRWPKYWSFSFSISPSNEYSRLISFRLGWLDLLTVQGTFSESLLQHHNLQPSVLQRSTFFMVQLLHPYIATGKIITSTIQTFVSKVRSLLFNALSRFVMAFLPKSKHHLILWL